MSEDNKAPTTVRELGMQFQGFKDLVDERFKNLTENITRLAEALEDSNSNKADKKDLDAHKSDFVAYKTAHDQEHIDLEAKIAKKPIIQILLWSLFGSLITAVFVYEITSKLNGAS